MDDAAIIDLYWARSETAIDETAKKYGGYCAKIAMNILQNHEDSEECVNDTYLKTWDAIPPQRPAIFISFLGRITRNLSLNRYKERNTKKRGGNKNGDENKVGLLLSELADCIPSGSNTETEYETELTAKTIDNFLYSVEQENRIIFVRRYWYADSVNSISERFNISESKVKSMLFRMRNKLKIYLEKEGVII